MTAVGIVGAGTMGSGIAQLTALAGFETFLHDPQPLALERGLRQATDALRRGAERGRWSDGQVDAALAALRPADRLGDLAGASVVIEAAPEDLELKREVFTALAATCAADAVFATNTSSIPITAIAVGLSRPERLVGMHFFNPPPRMPLVEVIPGLATDVAVVERAKDFGEKLGKRVIVARDTPGFLVNRCGRALYGEAFRLLVEGIAGVEQIDRICRLGGGFRMGPFELMDLVGIDVAYGVARSLYERSFGEPRWRPSPLQAQMAQSGNLGRKTGRGWYDYSDREYRAADPSPPTPGDGRGFRLAVVGGGPTAARLRSLAASRGFEVLDDGPAELSLVVEDGEACSGPTAVLCRGRSLASWEVAGAVGFDLPLQGEPPYCELTSLPSSSEAATVAAAAVFSKLGLHCEWVEDGPGLVLSRVLAGIVNEGAFALGEAVGSEAEVDAAVELGLNYPEGPIALGRRIGWERVRATLDGLWVERREERYRAAPELLRRAAEERADG